MKRSDSNNTLKSTKSGKSLKSYRSDQTTNTTVVSRRSIRKRESTTRKILTKPLKLYRKFVHKGSKLLERFYDPIIDIIVEHIFAFRYFDSWITKFTNPNHITNRIWSLFIAFISLYMIIITPFRISFFVTESWVWIPIDLILDAFLWIDVILSSLTPFQPTSSTMKVTKFRKTIWHYFTSKNGALLDIIPLIPLDWISIFTPYTTAVFRAHRILRAIRINNYFEKMEIVLKKVNPAIIRVANLLCLVVLLAHWITCFWYLIVRLEGESSIYWTASNILMEADTGNDFKYMLGMYWSLITMAGYGGSMPVSDIEVVFSILVVFLGIGVYVTIIGTVGSLVTNLDSNASKFREKLDSINDYMKYRSLESGIRNQVRTYYNYIWHSRKGLDETKIFEDLPDFLKISVSLHLHKDIIKKVPLLQNADDNFVSEIVVRLKPRVSLPDSYIIRMGESGREMFFLSRGQVDVVIGNGIVVAQFSDGSFFGEIALIYDVKRTATIRAKDFCDLFVLTKEDFDEICEAYPEEAHKIKIEAEQRYKQTTNKKDEKKDEEKKDEEKKEEEKKEVEKKDEEKKEEENKDEIKENNSNIKNVEKN